MSFSKSLQSRGTLWLVESLARTSVESVQDSIGVAEPELLGSLTRCSGEGSDVSYLHFCDG